MRDTLSEICTAKRQHIEQCKIRISENQILQKARQASPTRGFRRALQDKIKQQKPGLIAEIKKASPSAGVIRADFNPAVLAKAYAQGGAACLSVLTDEPYFQGKDEYLGEAREAVTLPVLRKDFMLDPYQVMEARALGADCILLIMAALSDAQAKELEKTAVDFGMDILVEVHDEHELDRALAHLKSTLIGINNRNLKTLKVDLSTSERLAKKLPVPILPVCESGISSHEDIQRMQCAGIYCFLVGESLMRKPDVSVATQRLLEGSHG
jgi:indole-3-glycerol phosphate synthase